MAVTQDVPIRAALDRDGLSCREGVSPCDSPVDSGAHPPPRAPRLLARPRLTPSRRLTGDLLEGACGVQGWCSSVGGRRQVGDVEETLSHAAAAGVLRVSAGEGLVDSVVDTGREMPAVPVLPLDLQHGAPQSCPSGSIVGGGVYRSLASPLNHPRVGWRICEPPANRHKSRWAYVRSFTQTACDVSHAHMGKIGHYQHAFQCRGLAAPRSTCGYLSHERSKARHSGDITSAACDGPHKGPVWLAYAVVTAFGHKESPTRRPRSNQVELSYAHRVQCGRPVQSVRPRPSGRGFPLPGPVPHDLVDRADHKPQPPGVPLGPIPLAATTAVPRRVLLGHRDPHPISSGDCGFRSSARAHGLRGPRAGQSTRVRRPRS